MRLNMIFFALWTLTHDFRQEMFSIIYLLRDKLPIVSRLWERYLSLPSDYFRGFFFAPSCMFRRETSAVFCWSWALTASHNDAPGRNECTRTSSSARYLAGKSWYLVARNCGGVSKNIWAERLWASSQLSRQWRYVQGFDFHMRVISHPSEIFWQMKYGSLNDICGHFQEIAPDWCDTCFWRCGYKTHFWHVE